MGELDGSVVAFLVNRGVRRRSYEALFDRLHAAGAYIHTLGLQAGPLRADDGSELPTDGTTSHISPTYYDGFVVPPGESAEAVLAEDGSAIVLLQLYVEQGGVVAGLGNGVALLADAGIIAGKRIACDPELAERVHRAEGVASIDPVVSDGTMTTGRSDADPEIFCARFAAQVRKARRGDDVDEASRESFPASDAHSGAAALPG